MSKITNFARNKDCTARIPGICNFNNETSAWCHINSVRWGSGVAQKSKDACGFIGCSDCHDVTEGRTKTSLYTKDQLKLMEYEAHMESLVMLIEEGIL